MSPVYLPIIYTSNTLAYKVGILLALVFFRVLPNIGGKINILHIFTCHQVSGVQTSLH